MCIGNGYNYSRKWSKKEAWSSATIWLDILEQIISHTRVVPWESPCFEMQSNYCTDEYVHDGEGKLPFLWRTANNATNAKDVFSLWRLLCKTWKWNKKFHTCKVLTVSFIVMLWHHKPLPPKLKKALEVSVKIVFWFRGPALNHRLFKSLCEDLGSEDEVLRFHTEVRRLSRERVFFEVREQIKVIPEECYCDLLEELELKEFNQILGISVTYLLITMIWLHHFKAKIRTYWIAMKS